MTTSRPATDRLDPLFGPGAISAETRAVNDRLAATLAALDPPADLAALRRAYVEGRLGLPASPRSPRARRLTIAGPGGPLDLRVLVPDAARGVYLHFHGGGWMAGRTTRGTRNSSCSGARRGWRRSRSITGSHPSTSFPPR